MTSLGTIGHRALGLVRGPACCRPLLAEAAQRFEQAIPIIRRSHDERSVDQRRQLIDDCPVVGVRADNCGRIGESERPGEHREPFETRPQLLVEQLVRPLDGSAKCLLTFGRGSATAGQQTEAIVEPLDHVGRRERSHPRRSKLDCQRNAIEADADLDEGVPVSVSIELWCLVPGATHQQLERIAVAFGIDRKPQGRQCHDPLSLDHQRFATGSKEPGHRSAGEDRPCQSSDVVEHVLAVVEQDQGTVGSTPSDDRGLQRLAALLVGTQDRPDGSRHTCAVAECPQLDHPCSIDSPVGRARSLEGQACLAHPTGAEDRDQLMGLDLATELSKFACTTDERRRRRRQVCRRPAWGGHRRRSGGNVVAPACRDAPVELAERVRWVQAHFVGQESPIDLVRPQCLGVAPLCCQRAH